MTQCVPATMQSWGGPAAVTVASSCSDTMVYLLEIVLPCFIIMIISIAKVSSSLFSFSVSGGEGEQGCTMAMEIWPKRIYSVVASRPALYYSPTAVLLAEQQSLLKLTTNSNCGVNYNANGETPPEQLMHSELHHDVRPQPDNTAILLRR